MSGTATDAATVHAGERGFGEASSSSALASSGSSTLASTHSTIPVLIPIDMTTEASQAAASIAMPQLKSRTGEPSEFQKGRMNIKGAPNREIGRRPEIDINEATVRTFLKRYQERESIENLGRSGRPTKIDEDTGNWVLELIEDRFYFKA